MKKIAYVTTAAVFGALMVSAPAHAAGSDAVTTEELVFKNEKPKKITDRSHPDYVRCRSEPVIGSLARKRRVCMTNSEWAKHNRAGSRVSREFVEDMQVGQNAE